VLVIVATVMVTALAMRADTELHVLRDRAPLFVTLSDGTIRNGYTLKILNKAREPRSYELAVHGVEHARITVVGEATQAGSDHVTLTARPDSVATYRVYVAAQRGLRESTEVEFAIRTPDRRGRAQQPSSSVSVSSRHR